MSAGICDREGRAARYSTPAALKRRQRTTLALTGADLLLLDLMAARMNATREQVLADALRVFCELGTLAREQLRQEGKRGASKVA